MIQLWGICINIVHNGHQIILCQKICILSELLAFKLVSSLEIILTVLANCDEQNHFRAHYTGGILGRLCFRLKKNNLEYYLLCNLNRYKVFCDIVMHLNLNCDFHYNPSIHNV